MTMCRLLASFVTRRALYKRSVASPRCIVGEGRFADRFYVSKWTIKTWQQQQRRFVVSEAVRRRIEAIVEQHEKVMQQLNSGNDNVASLGKVLSSLSPVVSLQQTYTNLEEEIESFHDMLKDAKSAQDAELEKECMKELELSKEQQGKLEQRLLHAVLPTDPDDHGCDAILEIRAGTGGDEASLFAKDLLDAYEKAAKAKGWTFDILSESKTDLGGIKDAAVSISSKSGSYGSSYQSDGFDDEEDTLANLGPYGLFKFESGVHRVQRVPVNDVRIHTSACSVAVLPSPSEDTSDPADLLPMSELKIERFRASGAGGQHVNTTESAVRITHIPTGITAAIQDERSQHKNKAKALKLVTARVRDRAREDEARQRGEAKSSLMGGGDRSERIRTYNFPQDRVTDHRCKHSEHGIASLLGNGLVATFAPHLRTMNREELLKHLEEEEK